MASAAVKIGAALVVPEQENSQVEIHTTLAASKISTASASAKWVDFSVSSWDAGASVLHCAGSVRLLEDGDGPAVATVSPAGLV